MFIIVLKKVINQQVINYINNSNFSKSPLKIKNKELPLKILVALTHFLDDISER